MSETEELKQMIMNFRVSELQVLLGFAGKNKTGKKQDLQYRALELLRMRSTPIQMKIRELHKRYPVGSTGSNSSSTGVMGTRSSDPSIGGGSEVHDHSRSSYSNSSGSSMKTSSYPIRPNHMVTSASMHPGSGMRNYDGASGGPSVKLMPSPTAPPPSSGFPIHPDVRFKSLPFYEILAELLKPTSLVPSSNSRFQETNFVFHLTPQQTHDVAMSRDVRPGVKNEYSVQIQLRFCLLETSCEQEDNFPPSIVVKVNSKLCPLPNPIPTNKPGVEPKRPSRPVNITPLCKLCPTVPNYITVSWASEYGRAYVLGVYLVRRLSSNTLLQKLRAAGVRNPDHTKAIIKEKLQQDPDSEIATTSLRGSLICPLGKMRMQTPCRANTCTHLQCFDGSLYLQMNEKKPTWICPVCDKPATFNTLVIDGLFVEITSKAPSNCTEVQFHDDGSWTAVIDKKESSQVIKSPAATVVPTSESDAEACSPVSSPQPEKKRARVEVIDLTIESSTDEEDETSPVASRTASTNSNSSSSSSSGGGGCSSRATGYPVSSSSSSSSSSTIALNGARGPNASNSIPVISLPSPSSNSSSSSGSSSSYPSIMTSQLTSMLTTSTAAPSTSVSAVSTSSIASSAGGNYSTSSSVNNLLVSTSISPGATVMSDLRSPGLMPQVPGTGTGSSSVGSIGSVANPSTLYNNMPILDSSASYYPPVSSPFDYLSSSSLFNYPNFDLYSMMQPPDTERQIPSYSTVPSSMLGRGSSSLGPDVISLD